MDVSNIHLYYSSPTAGLSDGVRIDTDDPNNVGSITVKLNSKNADEKVTKMAVRTDSGYYIDGNCIVSLTGDYSYWSILYNADYETVQSVDVTVGGWSNALSLSGVDDTNTIFWLKTVSELDEPVTIDDGAGMFAYGLVGTKESD